MYSEGFGTKIKNARKKWGFSQRDVEKETGIHQSTIARYENGKGEPNLEQLGILADFYQVSVDWLLGTGYTNSNKKELAQRKESITYYIDTRDNIVNNGDGAVYVKLTSEQIKKIKDNTI